ncbi:hypothetical protein [Priestia megaterium]|uniref:hypothetical protein n=1 Tax=Priestia megaterium TaxID=1404 RepID=UPI001CDD5C7A|nr:hypothetical protein [Priestia megaterium]MCA4157719.1 hypothetical protein [Priestia megaterium]
MYNYDAIRKAAKPFMTYSQIFGIEPNKDEVISSIEKSNLEKMLVILSQFCALDKNTTENVKNAYLNFFKETFGMNINKNRDEILFAPQATLYMFKWLLAHGKTSNNIGEIIPLDITATLSLHLKIADFLPKEIEVDDFLFHVLSFTKQSNDGDELARAFYIYTELAKQNELYGEKEFVDFNAQFQQKNGYTIEQYIAVTFALLTLVLPQKVPFDNSWIKHKNKFFGTTKLKDVAPKIIEDMALSMQEAKQFSKDTINNSWDYLKFLEKPLLKLNEEEFIPFNYDVLSNGLFHGLFHKIRNCYDAKDQRFLDFFGRPFEKYIEIIVRKALETSRLNYEYIPEFDYGKKERKLSSDLYLRLNKDLIIIEAKSARPTINATVQGDKESIEKDLNKLYVKPILQADKAFKEILGSDHSYKFEGVENIYIIAVNINNFPSIPSFYEKVDKSLEGKLHPNVKGYFNFSIADVEAMCYLISRKGKKPPIFKILNNKFNSPEVQSFSWFLEHSHIPIKRSPWVRDQLLKSNEKIYEMSLENPDEALLNLKKRFK